MPGELKSRWRAFDIRGREVRRTHREQFVRHLAAAAEIDELQAGKALLATFRALQIQLGSTTGQEGEAWDIFSRLPKDLKRLWNKAATISKPSEPARRVVR